MFDVWQGHLQAPGLEEWEYTRPSPQSPGLLPQAPWSQVSPFLLYGFMFKTKKKKLQPDGGTFRDGLFSGKRRRAASAKFRSVCLWVFAKDNVLIIKSRRNNSSDNTHWQGGGTLWAAANAGGLIPPMWRSKPIAAWQRMALWRCTWALQLWSPLFSVQAKWTFVLKTW